MTLQLPTEFIQSISCCPGFNEEQFIEAHQISSPTSIRINPFKNTALSFPLDNAVLWNQRGFYLKERPNFTHDVLFQAGCYYVQEAGSMFIEHALTSCVDFNETLLAFDVCASPGGKSTLLNSLLNKESALIANDVVKQRSEVLAQNLSKWGCANVVVTNNDPSKFSDMERVFDVILVDAPCSGSGLFRKQHDAIDEWSLDNVNLCSQRQKRILSDVIGSLKPGGTLLYSTCSYSRQENEDIIDWLITEFELTTVQIPIEKNWGIVETQSDIHKGFGYRFYPDKTKSEGFFCSVLKKPGEPDDHHQQKKNKREAFSPVKPKEKELFTNWINNIEEQVIIKFKDDYLLINQTALNFINRFTHLYLKKAGTTIGSLIKDEVIPHHDLALSIHRSENAQTIDCTHEQAILFLKKELQYIEGNKGWNLMSYNGFGLGWIKHLSNRLNNYLPNEFRILK
ncbi:MAG: RNA methyltransferase [Burkholderiales bacterium]|nr:RNA methyltransferase [Bacteroidia bacterium]